MHNTNVKCAETKDKHTVLCSKKQLYNKLYRN